MKVAPDTYLIPNLAAAEPGTYVPVNSLVILGEEPIIVDTGAPVHREHWLEKVYGLVDPEDIRWVFLSHEDGDHTGSLDQVLEAAPQATLVMNFFSTERLALERPVHLERMIWREPGEHFDAGDRRLHLVLPPIFDGPATRGLYDEKTGVLWAVDTFAALTTGAVHHVEDLPQDLYEESFLFFNSLVSPWHQFLDPVRYNRHVDTRRGAEAPRDRQRPRPDPRRRRDPRRLRPGPHPRRRADHRPARPGGPRRDPRRRIATAPAA